MQKPFMENVDPRADRKLLLLTAVMINGPAVKAHGTEIPRFAIVLMRRLIWDLDSTRDAVVRSETTRPMKKKKRRAAPNELFIKRRRAIFISHTTREEEDALR